MPGPQNPADVLSRMPLTNQPCPERSIAEEYICGGQGSPKGKSLEQISAATQKDEVLQRVQKALSSNQWTNNKEIQHFKRLRDELSTSQGLVLRGSRTVPPESLRESIIRSAHQGH